MKTEETDTMSVLEIQTEIKTKENVTVSVLEILNNIASQTHERERVLIQVYTKEPEIKRPQKIIKTCHVLLGLRVAHDFRIEFICSATFYVKTLHIKTTRKESAIARLAKTLYEYIREHPGPYYVSHVCKMFDVCKITCQQVFLVLHAMGILSRKRYKKGYMYKKFDSANPNVSYWKQKILGPCQTAQNTQTNSDCDDASLNVATNGLAFTPTWFDTFLHTEFTSSVTTDALECSVSENNSESFVNVDASKVLISQDISDSFYMVDIFDPLVSEDITDVSVATDTFHSFISEDVTESSIATDTFYPFVSEDGTESFVVTDVFVPFISEDVTESSVVTDVFVPFISEDLTQSSVAMDTFDPFVSEDITESSIVTDSFVPFTLDDISEMFLGSHGMFCTTRALFEPPSDKV